MEPINSFDEIIRILTDTLTHERVDLLAGKFTDLPGYAETKSVYLAQLDAQLSGPNAQSLLSDHKQKIKALQKLAVENEKLLLATKQGVKSAQERLTQLDAIESVVGTYTECGGQLRMQSTATTCKKIA